MGLEFKLPDVGEGVAEAVVVRWLVNERERVESDQPVVEVQTDKAVVELPSPAAGTIQAIRWDEGETVPVGEVLLVIREEGMESKPTGSGTEEAAIAEGSVPSGEGKKMEGSTPGEKPPARRRTLAAPSTRRLARDLGVDIREVEGSGPDGRVRKEDVRRAAAALAESRGVVELASGIRRGVAQRARQNAFGPVSEKVSEKWDELREDSAFTEEPLSRTRRVIAERLLFSVTNKPHATHFEELNAEGLVSWRNRLKARASEGVPKIGYLSVLLKAVAVSLKHHPLLNTHFDEEKKTVRRHRSVHLGVAADTPRGLLVPVIREVDRKNILQIDRELKELTAAAREGRLAPEQMTGSTFTVSNAGSLGGRFATPIINPPEVAILALHPVEQRPVVQKGELVPGWRMNVSLSFDHQVLDGADAIRFTRTLGSYTADPGALLLELT
ncbi:pyruvate dehydrogenase E2 component (dihydrolipoamide acetyltransferase) [Melghirimyces profundicolus]|uniref:Dihydrolipoamide acetyltransferase component of pyruvate dehydrogenase complex n=1 Tax=Melghirimyces profundicolus TaxID=1242148 RepID=A0A2T6C7I6_9BACL|nr:dihydrolipoamide acetyltransferase family protein [Melghirimyces profundicolus]PTX64236.1 pyruvate dehydrogenase E2 component (dihydrolipoamide acetyltransferase) [Melghirimyces profundicolus]